MTAITSNTFAGDTREAVTKTLEQFRLAMISGDSTQLAALTMPQLSYGHSGGHVEGQEEFIYKLSSKQSDFVTIDITDQTIEVVKDVAVVRHNLSATTNDKGVAGTVHLHILLVWQQDHGHWKLLARQAVKAK